MNDWTWDLSKLDAGELSALRHCAGVNSTDATVSALRAFYRACGGCERWRERYLFPAMCMDALWRETDNAVVKPMEECLKELTAADQNPTESLRRRIDTLLETPYDENGFLIGKMLNLVKILKSKLNLKPDFSLLAQDLNNWDRAGKPVQRKWLRVLYATKQDDTKKEDSKNVD